MTIETVDWLNEQWFDRQGEGVEYNASHDDGATTLHYRYTERLGYDGTTHTERTWELSHPFDEPCVHCEKWL